MSGNVVITSKEPYAFELAKNWAIIAEDENRIGKVQFVEKQTNVVWTFESESDAIYASKVFMGNFNFEFVKREVLI